MLKNKLFGMLTFIVGVMLVFALSGCDQNPGGPPPPHWEPSNIDPISGTQSGNAISFTYEGNPVTLTRNGGGDSLDGVWEGAFDGNAIRVTVSGSNWTMTVLDNGSYVEYAKGTITASGTTLIIMVTHVMDYGSDSDSGIGYPVGPIGPPDGSSYEGTWYGKRLLPGGEFHLKIVAENGKFTQYLVIDYQDIANSRGTYKVSGNDVTLTITDSNKNTFDGGGVLWVAFDSLTTEEKLEIHYLMTATMNGTILGDHVSMNMGDNETVIYTRQPTGSGTFPDGSGEGISVGPGGTEVSANGTGSGVFVPGNN